MEQKHETPHVSWEVSEPGTPQRIHAEAFDGVIQLRKHLKKLSLELNHDQLDIAIIVASFFFDEKFTSHEIEMARDVLFDAKLGLEKL